MSVEVRVKMGHMEMRPVPRRTLALVGVAVSLWLELNPLGEAAQAERAISGSVALTTSRVLGAASGSLARIHTEPR